MEFKLTIKADDADVLRAIGFIYPSDKVLPTEIFKDFFEQGPQVMDFTKMSLEEKAFHLNGLIALICSTVDPVDNVSRIITLTPKP